MTSNEKKALVKFKEVKQANTVAIGGALRCSIGYGYSVCKKLHEKGYLEMLTPGRFAMYKITDLGEEQVKNVKVPDPVIEVYKCPNCGTVMEKEAGKAIESNGNEKVKADTVKEKIVKLPVEASEINLNKIEESQKTDSEPGILNHPSVPEEWKTCNWDWK